jgi:hypothetical protein
MVMRGGQRAHLGVREAPTHALTILDRMPILVATGHCLKHFSTPGGLS